MNVSQIEFWGYNEQQIKRSENPGCDTRAFNMFKEVILNKVNDTTNKPTSKPLPHMNYVTERYFQGGVFLGDTHDARYERQEGGLWRVWLYPPDGKVSRHDVPSQHRAHKICERWAASGIDLAAPAAHDETEARNG